MHKFIIIIWKRKKRNDIYKNTAGIKVRTFKKLNLFSTFPLDRHKGYNPEDLL